MAREIYKVTPSELKALIDARNQQLVAELSKTKSELEGLKTKNNAVLDAEVNPKPIDDDFIVTEDVLKELYGD